MFIVSGLSMTHMDDYLFMFIFLNISDIFFILASFRACSIIIL